jgi:Group II intron, maturase-specific domain
MQRDYPTIPFERYADDAICHCASEAQALELRQALEQRFAVCRLRLRSDLELDEIARWTRPFLSGWVRYYGRFYPSKLREYLVAQSDLSPRSHGAGQVNTSQSRSSLHVERLAQSGQETTEPSSIKRPYFVARNDLFKFRP